MTIDKIKSSIRPKRVRKVAQTVNKLKIETLAPNWEIRLKYIQPFHPQ
jgi:hypothetical protein